MVEVSLLTFRARLAGSVPYCTSDLVAACVVHMITVLESLRRFTVGPRAMGESGGGRPGAVDARAGALSVKPNARIKARAYCRYLEQCIVLPAC
jgi:hypothetical protein